MQQLQEESQRLAHATVQQWEANLKAPKPEYLQGERLQAMTWEDDSLHLQMASDGLSLDAKLALEKALQGLGVGTIRVLFKRLRPLVGGLGQGPGSAQPAPVGRPFGITRELKPIPGVKKLIVVASGKGGVGKSTVSVNLAAALAASGYRTGLVDADIYGPSAQMMLGLAKVPVKIAPGNRLIPMVAHGVQTMSMGLLTEADTPAIWRGPIASRALLQLVYETAWDELDYLICDLPPGTGDIQLTIVEKMPVSTAIIVTTPQDVALIDAEKAVAMFRKLGVPIAGIVENMALYTCRHCGGEEAIFGSGGAERLAAMHAVPVIAHLPLSLGYRLAGDNGTPPACDLESPLGRAFVSLVQAVQASDN